MKTQKIFIYVASATDLTDERKAIKAAVNDDLNAELEGEHKQIVIRSYENYGERQEEYDDFIKKQADLVIFVLDNRIGDGTLREYLLAYRLLMTFGRPRIKVFIHRYDTANPSPEVKNIETLLAATTQDYAITYDDRQDLINKAKAKVRKFVSDFKPAKKRHDGQGRRLKTLAVSFMCLSALLLCLCGIMCFKYVLPRQDEVLLITGGGSAANYITSHFPDVDLDNYDGGYYLHMPSGHAWSFLTEEVVTPQTNRRYYPICLSAQKATDSCFLLSKSKDAFLKEASILGLRVGGDTLAVYLKKDSRLIQNLSHLDQRKITAAELATLLQECDSASLNVFTTSPTSGTRSSYRKVLSGSNFELNNRRTDIFTETSDWPTVNKRGLPYILLGSTGYYMRELDSSIAKGSTLRLILTDDSGAAVEKPVYVYCMAYCSDNSNILELPAPTIKFLRKLNINLGGKINGRKIKRGNTDNIILTVDDLRDF